MIPQYQSTTNIKSHHYCSPILSSAPQPTFSPISTCQPCRHRIMSLLACMFYCSVHLVELQVTVILFIIVVPLLKLSNYFLKLLNEWQSHQHCTQFQAHSCSCMHVILIFDFNYLKSKEYVILLFAFL